MSQETDAEVQRAFQLLERHGLLGGVLAPGPGPCWVNPAMVAAMDIALTPDPEQVELGLLVWPEQRSININCSRDEADQFIYNVRAAWALQARR